MVANEVVMVDTLIDLFPVLVFYLEDDGELFILLWFYRSVQLPKKEYRSMKYAAFP